MILSEEQKKLVATREIIKLESLEAKRKAQAQKELFGENWKMVKRVAARKNYENLVGYQFNPRCKDFIDIYAFTKPGIQYRDANGELITIDLDVFEASEKEFENKIQTIDEIIDKYTKFVRSNNLTEEEQQQYQDALDIINKDLDKKEEVLQQQMEESGIAEDVVEDETDEEIYEGIEEEVELPYDRHTLDEVQRENNNDKFKFIPDDMTLKEKIQLAKSQINQVASTFLTRFVPKYNLISCSVCGGFYKPGVFYNSYSLTNNSRIDNRGNRKLSVCIPCCHKLLSFYLSEEQNLNKAMYRLCADLNLYFDESYITLALKNKNNSKKAKSDILTEYIYIISQNAPVLTFIDSPCFNQDRTIIYTENNFEEIEENAGTPKLMLVPITEEGEVITTPVTEQILDNLSSASEEIDTKALQEEMRIANWSKEERRNRSETIRILGYDPFTYEESESDRKILYNDFAAIVDEDLAQDYVKLQSAITIVKSFTKVRQLDEKLHNMELAGAPLNDQKAVSDLKQKELKAISDFSRDSGFAERFKGKQSSGETSFSGIMKKMNEKKFEKALVNKYDIETSCTIQAAADASFEAIFKQLNLSDAEVWKLTSDQLAELIKLRQSNARLEEELRLTKYELAETKLKEKAQKEKQEKEEENND